MEFFVLAVISIIPVAILALVVWQKRSRSAATVPEWVKAAQRQFVLVVLRRAPADLQAEVLEAAARSAWSGPFGANRDGSNYVERGVADFMYVLQAHGNAFTVLGTDKGNRVLEPPTTFEPESAVGLWSDHTHDLSVSVTYNRDVDPVRLAAFVSTLTASLCDDQSVAVYHPASRRLWRLDESVRQKLADGSPSFFDSTAD